MTTAESFAALAPMYSAQRETVAGALSGPRDGRDARSLRFSPYANRLLALQTAMVPPKTDGTSERVAEIVKGLAEQGAIYPDQMGAIHSDLLNRAYTWNSMGVQESIQALVNDVIHGQNRVLQDELGRTREIANASLLTQFFDSVYKTVDRGQRNLEGFKKLLRLFVNSVPNAEVYKSGDTFSLQVNLGGSSQNINLSQAFDNLRDVWGARWDAANNPRIGALLTPNTRALLFFVSSFYEYGSMEPGSYLDNIMRLYKEAIKADVDAEGDAIMELGEAGANLNRRFDDYKETLNYLLQNRQVVPHSSPVEMSQEQTMLFRYLMRQLRQALKDRVPSDIAVSTMVQYVDPALYRTHKVFIERLQNYLLTAVQKNPGFYRAVVLNPQWVPPQGMYTGHFVIPDRYDDLLDELGSEAAYGGPSRDEYFDDAPYARRPLRPITDGDIDTEIANLAQQLDANVGVQSEAGWLTDHRLPALITQMNLGPSPYDVPMPPERDGEFAGRGTPEFFASLRPTVGTRPTSGLAPGLRGTGPPHGGHGARVAPRAPLPNDDRRVLARRATRPRALRQGTRWRFY
nr:pIIIa [Tawny frogmouth aviadenovirus A]